MFLGEKKIQDSMPGRLQATERFVVPDGHLRLTEWFFSIEGEGILIGVPCFLVRFAGCNLRCNFCDSKFAAWWDHDFELVPWQTVYSEAVASKHPGWISYTGGEPLFRRENELQALSDLILQLAMVGKKQKMETSGTVDPPDWFPSDRLFWSIAPKTAGMGKGTFTDPVLLQHILTTHAAPDRAHIKFVIGARKKDSTVTQDFEAVKQLLACVPALSKYPIIFQPEGLTESTPEYIERCILLFEAIQTDPQIMAIPNWRTCPQLHQIYWRNERRR